MEVWKRLAINQVTLFKSLCFICWKRTHGDMISWVFFYHLQLDDCTWGAIVGDAAKQRYKALGIGLEDVKKQLLTVNNPLEGRPEDMVITSHICRGNYHSTFFTSGPYDTVADYVFAKEKVINRIKQATKYIPLERLCLSPQCGFASCAIDNKLTEEEQWAKLKLVKEIAEEVWGE